MKKGSLIRENQNYKSKSFEQLINWSYLTLCLACYIYIFYVDMVGTEYKLMILLYALLWEKLTCLNTT